MKVYIYCLPILCLLSCKEYKSESINPNDRGTLTLHFDNIAGADDLTLNTATYTNASNETFTVKTLRYFISNIKLTTTDNKEYAIPQNENYFLVDESEPASQDIELEDIPAGNYNKISFILGVDSVTSINASNQTGVLDISSAATPYRNLNEGYIFFDMEGKSSASANGNYTYWIGGYGGSNVKTFNNLKKISLSFGNDKAEVRANIAPEAHFYVDILKVFSGTNMISIQQHPMVGFDDYSVSIANNLAAMITYGHVHNDPKK